LQTNKEILMSNEEHNRLDAIAADSWYAKGANQFSIEHGFRVISRYVRGGSLLEMGPAEGVMTPYLAKIASRLTFVEGAKKFCDDLQVRFPQATVVHSLFEDFCPRERFDTIVLGHVLEHVADPVDILRRAGGWLSPAGQILGIVPNARSLHRQAAVIMGLLSSENEMNETDIHHGHRRVYDPELFRSHFVQAGLDVESFGGYWLKPVSNRQIEESWTPEMLDAFMQLGERYPDIAGEIYVVATRR
jgi:2-polyprenyl-3-methyl-5-hydroxy-6-metoxy-1,4-benzoquinol methylase